MSVLDPLTEPLVRLFTRIDAAYPTDEALRRIADHWQDMRAGKVAPVESTIKAMPGEFLARSFVARLTSNGTQHWVVSSAGAEAVSVLGIKDGEPLEAAEKRAAVRVRRLLELVAEKMEPYSAMFEIAGPAGTTRLIEVFAAPLVGAGKGGHLIFAAVNSRIENK